MTRVVDQRWRTLTTLRAAAQARSQEPAEDAVARAPAPDPERVQAQATVDELDRQLSELEMDLARLGATQRKLVDDGVGLDATHQDEYTLYARKRSDRRGRPRVEYVFLREPGWDTLPAPRPQGFKTIHADPDHPPRLLNEAIEPRT